MKNNTFLLMVLFANLLVNAQVFAVKKLSPALVNSYLNRTAFNSDYNRYLKQAYSVVNNLPKNFQTDTSFDGTSYIQDVLDKHSVVLLPNYPVKINDKGLNLNNNQVLLFQPNSKLVLIPTAKNSYNMLRISKVNNIKIFYANLEGDRNRHLASDGQWGFGIGIKGSDNIKIYSPYIKNTWGDGIYLGQTGNKASTNIYITNAVIDNVRRNGISIVSAKNVDILNSYIANTNGNSPQSGIDVEPNTITDDLDTINIKNLTTFNNKWAGILLVFEQYKSIQKKTVSINIDGHKDSYSTYGIAFHGFKNDVSANNLDGMINLKNTKYGNNKEKFFFYKSNLSKLNLNTSDLTLKTKFNNFKTK
ncbi:right-handed parallel beta-helix repeat-containing protein [Chryseobacterium indoltheticum]|uniref:Right-handed parallel beta-helix repeat-containing protein n=1 Tax=Chryseobacterium indoltheticum TaxID=254 RepID=A0A3G6N5J3_9FLAO|nr:right-handed parallel beta-helix repeat-containing protein [Chryseobacterium indoltheticum]AZA62757.1 right-handed parallel beta-helix repeat-containing protein [Chryseobacterium indoltheticum]